MESEVTETEVALERNLYRLSEDEWWLASSMDEAIEGAAKHYGVPRWEVIDSMYPAHKIKDDDQVGLLAKFGETLVPMFMVKQLMDTGSEAKRLEVITRG